MAQRKVLNVVLCTSVLLYPVLNIVLCASVLLYPPAAAKVPHAGNAQEIYYPVYRVKVRTQLCRPSVPPNAGVSVCGIATAAATTTVAATATAAA